MILRLVYPAPDGSLLLPDAFAGMIGETVRVNDEPYVLTAATVAADGDSAELTLRNDDKRAPFPQSLEPFEVDFTPYHLGT